jgi:hypothetical protein
MYCSKEANQNDMFSSVVVFDSPLELLSYLTLEESKHQVVPSMDDGCCYIAMFNSNTLSIKDWLNKHDEIETLYIAIRLTLLNSNYIKKHLIDYAQKLHVPAIQELNEIIMEYTQRIPTQCIKGSLRIDGWNTLLRFLLLCVMTNKKRWL